MSTSWTTEQRPNTVIGGWMFNETLLQFNSLADPISGDNVMFNGLGKGQTWSTLSKS